eukprot:scaffold65890_cov87-Phaeocystis_antarctica.AAC.1
MPTSPSILYENETYCQPSDNLSPYPSRSPVRVGVLEFEFFRHGTPLRTRASGVANPVSGGYCASAVAN